MQRFSGPLYIIRDRLPLCDTHRVLPMYDSLYCLETTRLNKRVRSPHGGQIKLSYESLVEESVATPSCNPAVLNKGFRA